MAAQVDWNDQRAFLAVLEEGFLSAASKALGLTHRTVRARIEALEQALGTVLFTRSAQGLLPTEAARAAGEHARAMAHASDAFRRAASAPPNAIAGSVRLSVSEFVGMEVLPAMLARLHGRHPGLGIEVVVDDAAANLTEQEVDIAVRLHAPTQDTLIRRKVGEVALSFFASRDYLALRGTPETLGDLDQHSLIGPDRSQTFLHLARRLLPPAAVERVTLRTDSHPTQVAAARAGLGIVVTHQPVGLADPMLRPVLPGHVVHTLPVYIVAHCDLRSVPRVRAAFDYLAEEFARYARR